MYMLIVVIMVMLQLVFVAVVALILTVFCMITYIHRVSEKAVRTVFVITLSNVH